MLRPVFLLRMALASYYPLCVLWCQTVRSLSVQESKSQVAVWVCRARVGPLAADPHICPPGQHAVPDEHAPLMSMTMSDAVEDDASEVSLHAAALSAAKKSDSSIRSAFQLVTS